MQTRLARLPPGPHAADACSFCGRLTDEVGLLIAGLTALICDGCVRAGAAAIRTPGRRRRRALEGFTPASIKAAIDERVIGQERAKRALAVAVHNHHKRILDRAVRGEVELAKSNVLLVGESGSGKTLLARSLARIVGVPFVAVDATTLTETGFAGHDASEIALRLVEAAGKDIALAENGIVYLDEIDKLAMRRASGPRRLDIGGAGVQRSLLGIIEGSEVRIEARGRRPRADDLHLDTTNVLFICGGTFEGIAAARRENLYAAAHPAQRREKQARRRRAIEATDLIEYGFIPELVGRLPVIVDLDPLDEEDLVRILAEPRDSLVAQYRLLLGASGAELVVERSGLEEIARRALARRLGARSLRALLEATLLDDMFELPHRPPKGPIVLDRRLVAARLDAAAP
jgi:ATP-dependent Clp protease ATP-binding subunit ClpX